MMKDVEIPSGPSFWAYLWTGFKLFLISIVLGAIYYGIDALMNLFFKKGLFRLWIEIFKKTCVDTAGVCVPTVSTFALIVIIFFTLIWLILSLWIGGWMSRNLWKWT